VPSCLLSHFLGYVVPAAVTKSVVRHKMAEGRLSLSFPLTHSFFRLRIKWKHDADQLVVCSRQAEGLGSLSSFAAAVLSFKLGLVIAHAAAAADDDEEEGEGGSLLLGFTQ
jgi:hypothetical protein